MPFTNDIFISYAHIDNASLFEDQPKGWVDRFHYALDMRLQQLVGGPIIIWRDKKIPGGDYFDERIQSALLDSAILVSILSPRYFNSEWCMKEVTMFFENRETNQNAGENGKPGIFKVVKTPVPREHQPIRLRRILDREFFELEHATGKVREFWVDQPETRQKFTTQLDDVAQEILPMLMAARSQSEKPVEPDQNDKGGAIFLAKTTPDLQVQEDQLRRELKQQGHRIILGETLLRDNQNLEQILSQVLHESRLSIHPIGIQYESIVESQVEQAVQQCHSNGLQCVLWIPKGTKAEGPRQKNFHTFLREEIAGKSGVILMEPETLEILKNDIQEILHSTSISAAPIHGAGVEHVMTKPDTQRLTVRFIP